MISFSIFYKHPSIYIFKFFTSHARNRIQRTEHHVVLKLLLALEKSNLSQHFVSKSLSYAISDRAMQKQWVCISRYEI